MTTKRPAARNLTIDRAGLLHTNRFRKVSTLYPHMVALAYGLDIAAAALDSDLEVADRVATYERTEGLIVEDWHAIGAKERDDDTDWVLS